MNRIQIYVTHSCPYCAMALRLLDTKGVRYDCVDVTGDHEKRSWLRRETGQRTVPQVFIDGRSYGGYSDIAALDARGELDQLLVGE